MKKTFLSLIFSFVFLIFCPQKILAVTITINSFPSEINSLDNFQITASISGAVNATNYLRVDLYKDGASNYFGETYNGTDWYSGSDGKSYLPITIQSSSASATLFAQLGNPTVTQYPGPGSYKLKIRRYTSSGSASSNDDQTPVDIQINYVVPTQTPDPTSTSSPTQIPTPIATPVKTPTPTKTPTPKSTPTILPTDSPEPEILGEATTSSIIFTPTPLATSKPESVDKPPILGFILVGVGILFIGVAGYLVYRKILV